MVLASAPYFLVPARRDVGVFEVLHLATDMTYYAFMDAADAFVATDAFQEAKATLFVSALVVGAFVWLWQHFNSGKPGGMG